MTVPTKILLASTLALAISAALLLHRLALQRDKLGDLMQRVEGFETDIRQIRSEHDGALAAIASAQKGILALENQGRYPTTPGELGTWLTRVIRLKQWLRGSPGKEIPEMQFLSSNDWLSVTLDNPLDTDAKIRDALSKLRAMAKTKPQFTNNVVQALQAYGKANHGLPPTDSMQLQPYLNLPLSKEILLRYEPVPEVAGQNDANGITREGMHLQGSGRAILQEKAPVDEDYDTWILFTEKGGWATGNISEIGKTVNQAKTAFTKANNGQNASNPEQLLPYLPPSIEPGKLKEYWEISRH